MKCSPACVRRTRRARDVRVREAREDLRLVEEHVHELSLVATVVAQHLERGERDRSRATEVDRGHSAAADLRDDVVVAETFGSGRGTISSPALR